MGNKITALKIWDISWREGAKENTSAITMCFDDSEYNPSDFIDKNCREFNRWSISDEAVDNYFRKECGETPEEFCAKFCFEGEHVAIPLNNRKEKISVTHH